MELHETTRSSAGIARALLVGLVVGTGTVYAQVADSFTTRVEVRAAWRILDGAQVPTEGGRTVTLPQVQAKREAGLGAVAARECMYILSALERHRVRIANEYWRNPSGANGIGYATVQIGCSALALEHVACTAGASGVDTRNLTLDELLSAARRLLPLATTLGALGK